MSRMSTKILIGASILLIAIVWLLISICDDNNLTREDRCTIVNGHDSTLKLIKYRYPEWMDAEYYSPSWQEVTRAEAIAYDYMKKSTDPSLFALASSIEDYRCQFVGIKKDDKTFILCNYAKKTTWDDRDDIKNGEWKRQVIATWLIQDGGSDYFEAIVDLDNDECVRVEAHLEG